MFLQKQNLNKKITDSNITLHAFFILSVKLLHIKGRTRVKCGSANDAKKNVRILDG
jgi:hypothetical protein